MQDDPVYSKYYDDVVILLETRGLRISKLCGLTETDLNFEKRFVNVGHQLLRSKEDGYYIETPKTDSGFRQVPMSAAAYEAFRRALKNHRCAMAIEVGGYSNSLFLNRDGLPKVVVNYDVMFKCLAKKFNKCHKEPLPTVMMPYTMRHTFCTRMANAGMNPKALQYIMGHAHYRYDAEQLRTCRIPIRTGGNGAAGSGQGGNHRGEHRKIQGCHLNRMLVFTAVSTTFHSKGVREKEKKCELLPLSEMPERL